MKPLTVRMKADDVAELLIYDQIGGDPFFGGITAKEVRAAVKSVKAKTLNLRINSPGGSVTEGAAMLAALDEFKGRIEVDVDGLAASAASFVAMAGDVIRMAGNSLMMIHDPHSIAAGGSEDMRRMADLLDKVREQILDSYGRHAKVPRKKLAEMMAAETWLTPAEAVEAGLAHESTAPVQVAALARGGLAAQLKRLNYRRVPASLKAQANPMAFAVGDRVEWIVEDPEEMCAELECGCVEEVSEGTLIIPGTSLSLTGSQEDPAARVVDRDGDETCWYLVRASQLRKVVVGDADGATPAPGAPAMPGMKADDWAETLKRRAALAGVLKQ